MLKLSDWNNHDKYAKTLMDKVDSINNRWAMKQRARNPKKKY